MYTKEHFSCSCNGCHSRILSTFKHLNPKEIEELDQCKRCHSFKKGEYLYKENSYPTGIFCINSGKVKLTNSGDNGREHIIKIVGKGDMVGENAIFSQQPHLTSAIAMEETTLCFIPKESFLRLLRSNTIVTMHILQSLAQNIEKSQIKQLDLAQKTVKERLAGALILFRKNYGENEEGYLNISLSREEIADFIGTSTETVIRLLAEWKASNIITLYKKRIRINSLDQLHFLAGTK